MSFRDEKQRVRAVRALLATLFDGERMAILWDDAKNEPTDRMVDLCLSGGALSHGEMVLVRCAMDFWNGEGSARFQDVIYVLDGTRCERVVSLARAHNIGEAAIDQWIKAVEDGVLFL